MREGRELAMEVFTIVANEVIGLSATECTLMQFSFHTEVALKCLSFKEAIEV